MAGSIRHNGAKLIHFLLKSTNADQKKLFGKLTEQERLALSLRYGFEDGTGRNMVLTGAYMGCSKTWVEKLEQSAFKKLGCG